MKPLIPSIWMTSVVALLCSVQTVMAQEFDLQAAITHAEEGEAIHVPAGLYQGTILVNQSVHLIADGEVVIDSGGIGDVFRVTAPDVTIKGFVIRNTGISLDHEDAGITVLAARVTIEDNVLEDVLFGIYLKNAPNSVIRGNQIGGKDIGIARRGDGIRLWYSSDTQIENNEVIESRDVVMWFSDRVHLTNNRVLNGRYGLHFMYSDDNVLVGNHIEGNSVGGFLMYSQGLVLRSNVFAHSRGPSGYGIGLKDMDGVVAEDNVFIGNRIGVYLDNSPSTVNGKNVFTRNTFASNDAGMAFMPSVKNNQLVDNTFYENIEQVAVLGGGTFKGNTFTVEGRGNFWSDYRGFDLDGDGIGDVPYRSESLFENLMDREPKLRLFLYSPAQQALDLAARAFPVMKPRPKFQDTAPLMNIVPVSVKLSSNNNPAPMIVLASAWVALGMLVVFGGLRRFDRDIPCTKGMGAIHD